MQVSVYGPFITLSCLSDPSLFQGIRKLAGWQNGKSDASLILMCLLIVQAGLTISGDIFFCFWNLSVLISKPGQSSQMTKNLDLG